jgi:hypothetical protein
LRSTKLPRKPFSTISKAARAEAVGCDSPHMLSRTFLLVIALILAFVSDASSLGDGAVIRITTWNLEWFPNGSPKRIPAEEQAKRIAAAADVLRPLNSDHSSPSRSSGLGCVRTTSGSDSPAHISGGDLLCVQRRGTAGSVLGKEPAQAAWAEPWKSMEGVDPPRGFAFAWFKIGNGNIGVYSLHLKSNLIMRRQQGGRDHEVQSILPRVGLPQHCYQEFGNSRTALGVLANAYLGKRRSERSRSRYYFATNSHTPVQFSPGGFRRSVWMR